LDRDVTEDLRGDWIEPDIPDYGVDRLVVCDRHDAIGTYVANGFHARERCPVIAVTGHPAPIFETVLTMALRSRRLVVVVVHDASPAGCRLANHVATDPAWFAHQVRRREALVVDLGLRPSQVGRYRGCYLPSGTKDPVHDLTRLGPKEQKWLRRHRVELAAIPPHLLLNATRQTLLSAESHHRHPPEPTPAAARDDEVPSLGWVVGNVAFDRVADGVLDADGFG
jgi:hypothetical protein